MAGSRIAPLSFYHGTGVATRLSPSDLPYRANVYALKTLGVTRIVSVSAVGSLKTEIQPGHVVVVDQFIDRTLSRPRSFFGDGIVAHVGFADPVSEPLRAVLLASCRQADVPCHDGGTYVCIEGPQFSTRAESHLFRSWGRRLSAMTNLPEARLAREAEMDYATLALSTDYDCWHEDEDDVSVAGVLETLKRNVANAKTILRHAILDLPAETPEWPARHALNDAIMTARECVPAPKRNAAWSLSWHGCGTPRPGKTCASGVFFPGTILIKR